MTRLSEVLEHENYQKADPDKKRLILEDWYDFTIKSDPDYDSASDENIRTVIFRDVPPTHIQKTPSLLQKLPKALGEVFLPKEATEKFDPEGAGYDYETAEKYGISPDETGHWPSRTPETGQILKGRKHPTFHLTEQGEKEAGYYITKRKDGRYYSQPTAGTISPWKPTIRQKITRKIFGDRIKPIDFITPLGEPLKDITTLLKENQSALKHALLFQLPKGVKGASQDILWGEKDDRLGITEEEFMQRDIEGNPMGWDEIMQRQLNYPQDFQKPSELKNPKGNIEKFAYDFWGGMTEFFTKPQSYAIMYGIQKAFPVIFGTLAKKPFFQKEVLKAGGKADTILRKMFFEPVGNIFKALPKTAFQELGLKEGASPQAVKSAYRKLAVKWHPDKNPKNPIKATQKFIRINAAYEKLTKEFLKKPIKVTPKAEPFKPVIKKTFKDIKPAEAFKPIVKALPKSGVAQVDKAIANVAKTPGIKLDTLKKTLTGDIIGNMTPIADRKATPAAIKSALTKLENVKAAIKADDIDNLGMYNIYKPAEKPALEAFKPKAPVSLEAEAKKGLVKEEGSRFKTAQELLREVGRSKLGRQGLDINRAEAKQLTEYLLSLKDPTLATERGIVYKPYGATRNEVDIILGKTGFATYAAEGGKVVLEAIRKPDGTYEISRRVRVHATPLDKSKIVERLNKTQLLQLSTSEQAHKPEVKAFEPKKAKVEAFKPREEPKKVSGVAKSIQAKAVEKGLIDKGFNELAEYTPAVIKEQADKMATIMRMNIEKAKRIATGREALPEGLKGATALQVMEDYAMQTKDGQLAMDLANSPIATEISAAAQTLRLSAERTPDSATAKIKEIAKTREMVVEKKLKGRNPEKIKSTLKDSLKKKMAKTKPNKYDWNKFVDSITC